MKPQFSKPKLTGIGKVSITFWLDNEEVESSRIEIDPGDILPEYKPGSILSDEQLLVLETLYANQHKIKDISRIMAVADYGFIDVTILAPTKENGILLDNTIHQSSPSVVHRIVPSAVIGSIRGAGPWINPGVLSKFIGKVDAKGKLAGNPNIIRFLLGLPTGRITKSIQKIIDANPELLGPCERPYARFVKHHIEQLRLLTKGQSTGQSAGMSGSLTLSSRASKLQLLDDLEAVGPDVMLQDVLVIPSKALMTIKNIGKKRKLLAGFSRYSSISKAALGANTPAIESKDNVSRDYRAAHLLVSYLEANAQITTKILPGKRKLLKRGAMGQRSPVSGRHVLATNTEEAVIDEVGVCDSSLIIQGTAQLIYFIQQVNKDKGIYQTPEEVYLEIKQHTHAPTEDMYDGLEFILKTYKDLGLKGIPVLVQRFPSSRAANASILYATKIMRDAKDMCLTMSPQLFKSYNADTDGDECTDTMISHSIAKELATQMSPRDHFLDIGPLPYDTKLTSTDALYRMGVSLWFTSEKPHGVNGDKIFDLV